MIKNMDTRKQIWIIIGVIVLFLILLVVFVDVRAVFRLLRRVDWLVLLVSVMPLLAGYALITTRWRYILANKPAWWKTFQADSMGYMAKTITPLPLAVARVATTGGITSVSIPQATSGMVVERLMEGIMRLLTLIVLLTLMAAGRTDATIAVLIGVGLTVAALATISWLLRHREQVVAHLVSWLSRLPRLSIEQIRDNLDKLMEGLDEASSRGRMAISLLMSLVMWWVFFLAFHYLAIASIPIVLLSRQETLAIALAVLVIVPPSTLPMPGVYHGMVIGVLMVTRLADSTEATAYSIVLHLPQMILWIGFGLWSLFRTNLKFDDLLHAAGQLVDKKTPEQSKVDES